MRERAPEGRERHLRRPREESPEGAAAQPPPRLRSRSPARQRPAQRGTGGGGGGERYIPSGAARDPELAGYNPDDYDWDAFFNEEVVLEAKRRSKKEKKQKKEKEKDRDKAKRWACWGTSVGVAGGVWL